MKKCGIMTFNQALNYGAVLQMYALQNVICCKIGAECDVIDYRSEFFSDLYKKREAKDLFNIRFLKKLIFDNSIKKYNYVGFENFCDKNIKFSNKSYTAINISEINKEYSVIIAGSDQVFNPLCNGNDENFFLSYVEFPTYKGSYAASLGFSEIPESCKQMILQNLQGYKSISIREKTSADNLAKLLKDTEICVNIDPTLLLTEKEWREIADLTIKKPNRYILVYAISEDKDMINYARKCAKVMQCEVVYLTDRYRKPKNIHCVEGVTPEGWLSYFLDAEYVVTNSFHGVAFSVNFNKPFCPYMLQREKSINTRIVDLLRLVNCDFLLEDNTSRTIDFNSVNEILETERGKSLNYLNQLIRGYN